jgi:hypothetical protein
MLNIFPGFHASVVSSLCPNFASLYSLQSRQLIVFHQYINKNDVCKCISVSDSARYQQ